MKADKGAGAKRARYNSALMDADITVLGEELFNDEAHIIYVNGEYKENAPIGDLMHDFHCKKADDMKSKLLSDRARYHKRIIPTIYRFVFCFELNVLIRCNA